MGKNELPKPTKQSLKVYDGSGTATNSHCVYIDTYQETTKKQTTKKPRSQETTKKPGNHQETKKPLRNQETRNNQDTKKQ